MPTATSPVHLLVASSEDMGDMHPEAQRTRVNVLRQGGKGCSLRTAKTCPPQRWVGFTYRSPHP